MFPLKVECAFAPFNYVYCENCVSGFSAFVRNLIKSGSIFFILYILFLFV